MMRFFILFLIVSCGEKPPAKELRNSVFSRESASIKGVGFFDKNITKLDQKIKIKTTYYDTNDQSFKYFGDFSKISLIKVGGGNFSYFKVDNSIVKYKNKIFVIDLDFNIWEVWDDFSKTKKIYSPKNKKNLDFANITLYKNFIIYSQSNGVLTKIDLDENRVILSVDNKKYSFFSGFEHEDGEILYGSSQSGEVFGINVQDFSTIFSYKPQEISIISSRQESYLSSPSPKIFKDEIFFVDRSQNLIFLNKKTGIKMSSQKLGKGAGFSNDDTILSFDGFMYSPPIVNQKIAFFGSKNGTISAIDLEQRYRLGSINLDVNSASIVSENFIYFITSKNDLVALNAETGMLKWSKSLDKYFDKKLPKYLSGGMGYNRMILNFRGPIFVNDEILISSPFGKMLLINIENGEIEREIAIPECVFSTPIVDKNAIFGYSLCTDRLFKIE